MRPYFLSIVFFLFVSLVATAQPGPPICSPGGTPTALDITCQKPTFRWEKPNGTYDATGYELYLGTDFQFEILNGIQVTDTFFVLQQNLELDTEYQWIVIPYNEEGKADGCTDYHHFRVRSSLDPTAEIFPSNFSICLNEQLQFSTFVQHGHGPYGMFDFKWRSDFLGLLDADSIAHPHFSGDFPGDFSFEFTITDVLGCFGKDTVFGIVKAGPTEPILSGPTSICRGDSLIVSVSSIADSYEWEFYRDSTYWISVYDQEDPVLNLGDIQDSETYRVVVERNGCTDTSMAFVQTVLEKPLPPQIAFGSLLQEPYVCQGDSLLIWVTNYSDSIVFNGEFYNDSVWIYDEQQVHVLYTAENLCTSSTSVFVEGRTAATDVLTIPIGHPVICSGDSIALKVVSDTTELDISWSTGDVGSKSFVNATGMYFAEIINKQGCTLADTFSIEVVNAPDDPVLNIGTSAEGCSNEGVVVEVLNFEEDIYWDGVLFQTGPTWTYYETGTHYVTFAFNENCTSETSFDIAISPSPPAPTITDPEGRVICGDRPLEIYVVSEQYHLRWFGPESSTNDSLTVSTPGRYFAEFVNGFDCADTSFIDITHEELPVPPVLEWGNDTLEVVNPIQNATYRWFLNGTFYTDTQTPFLASAPSGSWTVSVREMECFSDHSNTLMFTSVAHRQNQMLQVYPNPSEKLVYLTGTLKSTDIIVLNSLGQRVHNVEVREVASQELQLTFPVRGIFMVKVGSATARVVIE